MDIPTTDSEDEYDGGTISEFEGSDDSMEGDDALFDPEAISDVESDASSDDESIETLSAVVAAAILAMCCPRFRPQMTIQFLHDIIVICKVNKYIIFLCIL